MAPCSLSPGGEGENAGSRQNENCLSSPSEFDPSFVEDNMKILSRTTLPALALLASIAVAQAQTQSDEHQGHHPDGQSEQAQPAPDSNPAPSRNSAMPMQGMMGGHDMRSQGMMGCSMMRQAQGGDSGGMSMMHSMKHDTGMGMPFEHVEGRIAFLATEIGITDAQQEQWNAFADALRRNADAERSMHNQMMAAKGSAPLSWLQQVQQKARMMSTHAEALKAVQTAAEPLFAALSADQRQKAEALLSGPMGMI